MSEKTITKGLRMSQENADKIGEIQAEFANAGEFANWIIEAYKLQRSKNQSELFSQDTKVIMDLFQSMLGTVNGMVARAEGMSQAKEAKVLEDLRTKDSKIEELKEELSALQTIISNKDTEIKEQKDILEESKKEIDELKQVIKVLQEDFQTTKDLNSMLKQEKAQYGGIAERNEVLVSEVAELREKLVRVELEANTTSGKYNSLLDTHKEEIMTLKEGFLKQIADSETKHKQELEYQKGLKELEILKAEAETKNKCSEVEAQLRVRIDRILEEKEALQKQIVKLTETKTRKKNTNIVQEQQELSVND